MSLHPDCRVRCFRPPEPPVGIGRKGLPGVTPALLDLTAERDGSKFSKPTVLGYRLSQLVSDHPYTLVPFEQILVFPAHPLQR